MSSYMNLAFDNSRTNRLTSVYFNIIITQILNCLLSGVRIILNGGGYNIFFKRFTHIQYTL